jgi:glycosyltransferase involved in cell wall biosynthesis
MRVLMTADTVGGVWTYALEAADALADDVELHLATMGELPDADQRAAAAASAVAGLHESSYALEWDDEPWEDVDRAGLWLLELARDLEVDLLHLNGYAHAVLAWDLPIVVAAHSDVISWWRAVARAPVPTYLERYRATVADGLRSADAVCAPTHAVLADLAQSYGFAEAGFVVPNGRAAVVSDVLKEPLVAGLGRAWDEAKNVAALERVATRVPWRLEIAGPGTTAGRLSQASAADLLARASIFASPARYEPFGLAALEAAQAGCALVLGDLASQREVWGDAALYVPPDEDEAIAAALALLCGDDELRGELAARARSRAARYTPAAMADALLRVYAAARKPNQVPA